MDSIKKATLNIPTLDGPNWGIYATLLQAAARILDCWDIIKGEILSAAGVTPITFDRLEYPTTQLFPDAKDLAAAKVAWNKKNAQALGLIQTMIAPALWQNYVTFGRAHLLWAQLETDFGRVGGASTYLQLVNMVKIEFTDSTELLPQIQQFLENYNRIMSNGHSKLSEDLATFMFCSSLPSSYEQTARQYLDGISAITNYKIQDIIARVLQEESRRKAQSVQTGSSINKFSTVKNYGQKCAKCGKTNHSTQNHWLGGKNPNKSSGAQNTSQKRFKKAMDKGKSKAMASTSANVLDMGEILELSIVNMNNIDFSCYNQSETVEWFLDSGSTEHITPVKSDFVQYREFAQPL